MTRDQKRTGLGLLIVKPLVDLINGEIRLESQINQGSTFTIILPLVPRYLHDRNRA
jgi:signal transduction histidine kinase